MIDDERQQELMQLTALVDDLYARTGYSVVQEIGQRLRRLTLVHEITTSRSGDIVEIPEGSHNIISTGEKS